MNNPRLRDLQYLNDNIGQSMWIIEYSVIPYGIQIDSKKIKVKDHTHALKLFEMQQRFFREGGKIEFDETPY